MYTPLHIKSNYSLLESLISIPSLIERAKNNQISSLAIADKNVLFGAMEFYNQCKKNNIKPIIGVDLDILEYHILLYAMNFEGYQNLVKLVTLKDERDLTLEDIQTYASSLICILPDECVSFYETIKLYYLHFYIGYYNPTHKEDLLRMTDRLVYVKEVLYLDKEDAIYLGYARLIKHGKLLEELNAYVEEGYAFEPFPEANELDLARSNEIASLCNLEFPFSHTLLPKYDIQIDAGAYLEKLCMQGLYKRLCGKIPKSYYDRLLYELDVIKKMEFCDYFLVVYDYVKYAKKNNIAVGPGRGSAAGSLISYSIGITDIDPMKYQLLFERFLNPERITMPDIDIDFEDVNRDKVIDYVIERYGKKRAANIITFGTLKGKLSVRDVGRIFEIPSSMLDRVCSYIPNVTELSLGDILAKESSLRSYLNDHPNIKQVYQIAQKLEGVKRHISTHAAGVVISSHDLDEIVPLVKVNQNYLIGYEMGYLEQLGLLKMDFLGLKNLTIIKNVVSDIEKMYHVILDFNTIPLNDPKTLDIFHQVNTVGIFQFESAGMKNFLRKLKPNSLEDIIAAIALFRPGPMENIDHYIARKNGTEPIDYFHEDLIPILKPTYGIIVYQEQIMQIANVMAGYTFGEADILRRAMSKKKREVLENERSKFISQSIARGYEEEVATKVYDLILKFANYGFNRAHSVSYAVIGYKMAYLKSHYPLVFIANLLNNVIGSEIKTKEYIAEAKLADIHIIKPDILHSGTTYEVVEQGIYFPLSSIKGIGAGNAQLIVEERNKKNYEDIYDFVGRTNVNRKVMENLILSGAFDCFGYTKATLMNNIDLLFNYRDLIQTLDPSFVEKPELISVEEFSKGSLMKQELEIFGFYLDNHPVLKYKNEHSISVLDIGRYFNRQITMVLYVDYIKSLETKKKELMAFVTASDEMHPLDVVLFPRVYENHRNLKRGMVVRITGKVERRLDRYQLIAQTVDILE